VNKQIYTPKQLVITIMISVTSLKLISRFMEYAAKYPGEILELACGTGRVAFTLAQNGLRVSGIDLSASMLEQFELKLQRESGEVRERIRLTKADMADFALGRKFSLIIAPFRAFQSLTNIAQQRNCQQCFH
jgi:ubiquinone/menaquinone biosynthesis C-methylase UbiE